MGVPKKHKTRSGRDQRRSHHALKAKVYVACKNCGATTRTHEICQSCGFYKGRQVRKVK
ncbi:MAG: 50S ribosomal protein L32 [Patescibacteria group bacterium]